MNRPVLLIACVLTVLLSGVGKLCAADVSSSNSVSRNEKSPEKSALRVLFIGNDPEATFHAPYYVTGEAAKRYVDLQQERTPAFMKLLTKHFTNVRFVKSADYTPELSSQYDVTVFDALPPAIENVDMGTWTKSVRMPRDFDQPAVMIGNIAPTVLGRHGLGLRLDHKCECLDAHAHSIIANHEIFHSPNQVELSIEDLPIAASYHLYAEGSELGETMPMWRVQTEGYQEGKGMVAGTVSYDLDDAVDGEYISSGVNLKGPRSMAIGRQGSYLHWGFSASPVYLTDEAKLVLVNAIHYITQFKGQQAFSATEAVRDRHTVDDLFYRVSEQGMKAWKTYTEQSVIEDREIKEQLRQRQVSGEDLTRTDTARLAWPEPSWSPADAVAGYPQAIRDRFGDDLNRYVDYYRENRPYLWSDPAGQYSPLVVDEDAKALGIANNVIRLLDACIETLVSNPGDERAHRLLARYTGQDFQNAAEWTTWLDARRDYLFFADFSGYQFRVDINKAIAAGRDDLIPTGHAGVSAKQIAESGNPAEPSNDQPVVFSGTCVRIGDASEHRFRLKVHAKILDGWHLYAEVPPTEAYVATKLKLSSKTGVKSEAQWTESLAQPSRENPSMLIWEHECTFAREIQVDDSGVLRKGLELSIAFQACNNQECRPVKTVKLRLELPDASSG